MSEQGGCRQLDVHRAAARTRFALRALQERALGTSAHIMCLMTPQLGAASRAQRLFYPQEEQTHQDGVPRSAGNAAGLEALPLQPREEEEEGGRQLWATRSAPPGNGVTACKALGLLCAMLGAGIDEHRILGCAQHRPTDLGPTATLPTAIRAHGGQAAVLLSSESTRNGLCSVLFLLLRGRGPHPCSSEATAKRHGSPAAQVRARHGFLSLRERFHLHTTPRPGA